MTETRLIIDDRRRCRANSRMVTTRFNEKRIFNNLRVFCDRLLLRLNHIIEAMGEAVHVAVAAEAAYVNFLVGG